MNKIYRRLWSTARQCWVVASELTSPRGKASQTVGAGLIAVSLMTGSAAALAEEQAEDDAAVFEDSQLLWAMQAAFGARSMSVPTTAPSSVGTLNTVYQQYALTTDNAYRNSTVSGNHLVILGSRSSLSGNQSVAYGNLITSRGDSNTAIGHGVQITGGGYATGVGAAAVANGIGATALGHDAKANTQNSIAVGSGSRTDSGAGISKIAIGGNAYAGTGGWTGAIALGGAARAEYDSVAIGYEAKTSATMSVALGRGSIATESNTVSVGSAGKERRIVNVKDGNINGSSTDAVNGRQLSSARDLAQRGVNDAATAQRVATGAKSTADQALANTKLVTQTSASSGIRIGGDNTGNVLTVSNKNGDLRYLNGVRNATLSATSTDAVTGQQLFATNQRLDAAGRNTATGNVISEANKATATGNLSLAMGQVAKANGVAAMALGHGAVAEAGNAVAIGSASGASGAFAVAVGGNAKATHENSVALGEKSVTTGAKQVSVGNATMKRKIINVDDGAINASSSEAVTGKQMYVESQRVNGLVKQASAGGIMYLGAENTGKVLTVSNKDGGKRYVNGVQNATLSASSSDAVTGQQLFATNNNVTTAQNTANNALGRANALGGLVSQAAADGNVRLGGENTGAVLDVRNKANANRTLSGLKEGAVNGTSTEAVTGKQLNTTNTEVASVRTVATAAQTTANTAKTTADSALGKANTLGGLVSQVAADGNVRLGGENTGSVLDVRNKSNANRTLSGLNDGAVNATSTEAVTGKQLNSTNTEVAAIRTVATSAQTTANTAKTTADSALGKANTLGGLVSQVAADGNVRLGGENTGSVLDVRNKANANRTLSGLKDGAISATSTEAVTGKQLNTTNTEVASVRTLATSAQTTANTAKTTADNALGKANTLGGLVSQVAADGSVRIGGENTGAVLDVRNKSNTNRTLSGLKDGAVHGTSTEAVTGKQLNTTNTEVASVRTVATAAQTAANSAKGTADNALGKANTLGGLVSQIAADGNVRLGGENTGTVLDVRNKSNANRTLSGLNDGAVNASSAEAVTGKQLFATNEKVEANEGVLAGHTRDLAGQSGRIADNRRDLDALRSEFEDFDPDLDGVVKFSADGSVDIAGGKLRGVASGDISSAASTDAVNGGQLFATNERIGSIERLNQFLSIGSGGDQDASIAGQISVAVGDSALASPRGEGAVSVGAYSAALGDNSVAIGRAASVRENANSAFALGTQSLVEASGGLALGARSRVWSGASDSVALGNLSVADEPGTVSVGHSKLQRRISNVSNGKHLTDASTISQLGTAVLALGGDAKVDVDGNIVAPTYNVQGGTQNNVGDALAALDSAVVTADSRVDNLEGKLRSAFQDGPSVRADGLNQLVLAGANGSVLTNLADGRIAAGSRDAVTGSQLFEAKQEIARNRSDLNDLRGGRDGLLSRGLMAAEQGNVIDYGGARLTGVADGVVSPRSNDVVVGSQLYASNERIGAVEGKMRNFAFGVTPYEDEDSDPPMAGKFGVSIGDWSKASPDSEGAVAVGFAAVASGKNSVALGRGSHVHKSAERGFAVGTESQVGAFGGIALGAASVVGASAFNAVALGAESIAEEANTVSVGHRGLQRRIVNVANGRNATDAATVGQLRGALATLGGDVDANGNIVNPTFNVQGAQQSTLNDALSSLDSAVVTTTARTERVESQLRAVFQDSPSVRNDGLNQLTFAGANGMVLSNVANGAIAAGSRDAVNGGQLHSMQQQLNGRMDGLEQRIDGQPQAPQSRSLTVAAAGGSTASSTPAATPADDEPTAPPPSTGDNKVVADAGNAPKSSPQPQADAPKPESPTPQVDTAELEKMLARANEYSDGISREVDRRLDKMDKRFNRMAAMTSAQSAMAMNTAGLNTYNRLGAGVGYSEGESAMAVGYQRVLNDKGSATFSLNGAFTNSGERSMGVGVGIGW